MATGDLKLYLLEEIDGDIVYATTLAPLRLGGLSNPNMASVSLTLPMPSGVEVSRVLLEMGIVSREYPERMRWRLWFDNIAVSREYRPKSIAELGGEEGYYSKAVFDVTPVFDKSRDIHEVTVAYEGSNPIVVEHVGMLAVYRVPDSRVSYAFISGALALKPGESYRIGIRVSSTLRESSQASIRAVISIPSKDSDVEIQVNDAPSRVIRGIMGVEEIVIEDVPVADSYSVRVVHRSGSKPLRLSTIIVSVAQKALPEIVFERVERHEERVLVRLANKGSSKPERVMLLVIIPGEHIERVEVEPLAPGEARDVEVHVPKDKRITLRVVWVKHGKPYQHEVRV